MRFGRKILCGGSVLLMLGCLGGLAPALAQSASTSSSGSSSQYMTKAPTNSANSQSNSSSSFSTSGNVGGGGATTGGLGASSGTTLPYLSAAPELNGPGSRNWCAARSSCAQTANQCAENCQNNTVANGTAQSDSGDAGTASSTAGDTGQQQITTSISNTPAADCTTACQINYQSCSAQVTRYCELSQ